MDASYAMHIDCQIRTEATILLVWGWVASMPNSKNLNSRVSTEVEQIRSDNALPEFLVSRYFIEAQGLEVKEVVVYQDKLSAILLGNNCRLSSENWMKHIRIRYFLIKDRIVMVGLEFKYCPMGENLADHFTKPLQGADFQKFRAEIQEILEDTPYIDLG